MSNDELLNNYKQNVEKIRETAKELNMSDDDIDNFFEDCLLHLKNENYKLTYNLEVKKKTVFDVFLSVIKYIFIFIIFIVLIFIVLHNHQPTFSLVLRNVQEFVYPSLKLLRILAVPIIQLFPNLSDLYDESCLIENPYFQVSNMECWPCENVRSVLNATKTFNPFSYQTGVPYLTKSLENVVTFEQIQALYKNNSKVFDTDAHKLNSNSKNYTKIKDLSYFELSNDQKTHISWRINRMAPARILRQFFTKPNFISDWSGQSTERYLFIDEKNAEPYILPSPECSYVLLTQGFGERTIILKPSKECVKKCRTLSIVLKEKYSLWYNWWYYRPISISSENSTAISITYLTSYC